MMTETVRITVLANGKKYVRTMEIVSDGSYHTVQNIIATIVGKDWQDQTMKFYWNYA